jgi:hypothetical protein
MGTVSQALAKAALRAGAKIETGRWETCCSRPLLERVLFSSDDHGCLKLTFCNCRVADLWHI